MKYALKMCYKFKIKNTNDNELLMTWLLETTHNEYTVSFSPLITQQYLPKNSHMFTEHNLEIQIIQSKTMFLYFTQAVSLSFLNVN